MVFEWSRNPLGLLHSLPLSPQGAEDLDLDMDLVYPDSPPVKTEDVSSSLPPPTPMTPLIDEDILEIWTLPSVAQPSVSNGTNGTTTQQVSANGVGRGDPRSRRKVFVAKADGLRVI